MVLLNGDLVAYYYVLYNSIILVIFVFIWYDFII